MTTVRGRPRSKTSAQAILTAAERLFGAHGYAGTSIEAVAKEAGVGKQTVYRWWPTKSHLAADIYEQLTPGGRTAPDTGKLRTDITAMLRPLFASYSAGPAAALLSGLIVEAQGSDTSAMDFRKGFFDRRRAITASLFERARDRGEIANSADVDILSDMLIGAIWTRLLAHHAPLDNDTAENLASHLVAAANITAVTQ